MEPRTTEESVHRNYGNLTQLLSRYLAVAMWAMGLSLACQVAGKGNWGNFITQWCQPG
jgi:hypothetical protein